MSLTKINCPKCNTAIDVNNLLSQKLQGELQSQFERDLASEKLKLKNLTDVLETEKLAFEAKKAKENQLFQNRLDSKIIEARVNMEAEIKAKCDEEQREQFLSLQTELNEKTEKVKELNLTKAMLEKLRREKEELRSAIEAESQLELNKIIEAERIKIKKGEEEKNELKLKELQLKYDTQVRLTDDMRRKQEQGSMQMQGEVQELAIEEWLKHNFPFDTIVEVKKGARGADCRHIVNTRAKENCGSIYYESKRTKDFGKGWIEKFKNDIREHGATIGIFVTDVLPQGMERMGLREGIWICSYEEFKGLCFVIREHITALDLALSSQENKGDKMVMLYDYLTSNEFRLQVEGIIEGYTQMQADLEAERRSITGHWKKREKQLQKVLNNTNFMYSSLRGIAGNAIQQIRVLEIPELLDDGTELE